MRTLALLLCCTLGTAALAAVPVVESRGQPRNSGPAVSRSESVSRNDPVDDNLRNPDVAAGRPVDVPPGAADAPATEVFSAAAAPASAVDTRPPSGGTLAYQVQLLQQELQQLRGVLEEQQHRIARMESDQKSRYADMDRRMTGAAQPDGTSGSKTSSASGAGRVDDVGAGGVTGVDAGERAAYAAGVQLTREKRYEAAIDVFAQQLTDYPDGAFSANAFYWLGESYLALPKPALELARQSFAQVVNLYPDHPKLPDALYKLGVVYARLGDRDAAERSMRRVRDDFPGTSAASLAEAYLSAPN